MQRTLIISTLVTAFSLMPLRELCAQKGNDLTIHVTKNQKCKKVKQNDLMAENLKGKVKTTITWYYWVSKDAPAGPILANTTTAHYDSSGNLTESKQLYPDKSSQHIERQTFDAKGNILTKARYETDGRDSDITIYHYGPKDILTDVSFFGYMAGKEVNGLMKRYDGNGNMIQETGPNSKKTYQYDGNGNCTQKVDSFGGRDYVTVYTYNEHCKMKESSDPGSVKWKHLYKYDDRDSLIEYRQESYGLNHDTIVTTYKYDANGNKTEEQAVYTATSLNKENAYLWLYKYEYDDKGNWLKITQYQTSELAHTIHEKVRMWKRQIVYY